MYEKYGNCYFTIIPVKQITDHRGCLKKCVFSRSPSLGAVHGLTEDFDGIRKQLEAVAPQHTHVALPFRIENARSQNGIQNLVKWAYLRTHRRHILKNLIAKIFLTFLCTVKKFTQHTDAKY